MDAEGEIAIPEAGSSRTGMSPLCHLSAATEASLDVGACLLTLLGSVRPPEAFRPPEALLDVGACLLTLLGSLQDVGTCEHFRRICCWGLPAAQLAVDVVGSFPHDSLLACVTEQSGSPPVGARLLSAPGPAEQPGHFPPGTSRMIR